MVDLSDVQRFETEHIPGAVHGWWQDGMDPHAEAYGERFFPSTDPGGRARWFASLGIDPDSTVIAYGDYGNVHAARLVWLLADSGPRNAAILDGGLPAWKGAGFSTVSRASAEVDAQPEITGGDALPVVTTSEIATLITEPDDEVAILDTRSRSERNDTMTGVLPIGQIPGNVWVPQDSWYLEGTRLLLPSSELRELFLDAGIEPTDTVIVYGQFGIDTGLPWAILTALGYEDVRIYDQGWVTWADDSSLPTDPLATLAP